MSVSLFCVKMHTLMFSSKAFLSKLLEYLNLTEDYSYLKLSPICENRGHLFLGLGRRLTEYPYVILPYKAIIHGVGFVDCPPLGMSKNWLW